MSDKLKDLKKKFALDCVVAGLVAIVLIISCFFWGCKMDLAATILAAVLLVAGIGLLGVQYKKLFAKLQ